MKVGKIERNVLVPVNRSEERVEMLNTLRLMSAGESVLLKPEPGENHKRIRWVIADAATRVFGKGNYAVRKVVGGFRVWRVRAGAGSKAPQAPSVPVFDQVNRVYRDAKTRMLAMKPGQSITFPMKDLNKRQLENMAYNGLGRGHFKTHVEGNSITVWRK